MPLPKPELDDKTFDQLVEEAKKLIPVYAPQWTDHNWSDPGITLIDLFAWLTEILLYRTNYISDEHRQKYLRLLGIRPEKTIPAKVDLTFGSDMIESFKKDEILIRTEISGKNIYFELDDDITIAPIKLEKVIVDEMTGGVFDRTRANEQDSLFFAPFGMDVQKGCTLYLGFGDNTESLTFMCYLYENDLIEPGEHGDETDYRFENATFKWELSHETSWKSIQPMDDMTDGFKKSGRLVFTELKDWTKSTISTWKDENNAYFWLRCVIDESNFEYPPRIETIRLNTISATNGMMIRDHEQWICNGLPNQTIKLTNYPKGKQILDRTVILFVEMDNVFNWDGDHDRLRQYLEKKIKIEWTSDASIEKIGTDAIKLTHENGLILLTLNPENKVNIIIDGMKTQELRGMMENSTLKIFDGEWIEVDDFNGSGPDDNHFILDNETGEITFGDGLMGRVPRAGSEIKVIQYRVCDGESGNIKQGCNWNLEGYEHIPDINNRKASIGGKNAESIDDATERFLRDLKVPYRAVTSEDFEYIAMQTPGLRVAKAKAIPNYHPEKGNDNEGSVTVIVIPETPLEYFEETPKPSIGFLNAICLHLEKHRLLGTEIHVSSPHYIKVNVNVTITPPSGFSDEKLRNDIIRELNLFLHPIKGWNDNKGWPIGRDVYHSEIYELLETIVGVDCVITLSLSGNDTTVEAWGLDIPDIATVYAGKHSVNFVRERDDCRI